MNNSPHDANQFVGLPGADLVSKGLHDLATGTSSAEGLLVLIAQPALQRLGIPVADCPSVAKPYEHRLYEFLEDSLGADAYSQYNALLRRIVSFVHAMEREQAKRGSLPPATQQSP